MQQRMIWLSVLVAALFALGVGCKTDTSLREKADAKKNTEEEKQSTEKKAKTRQDEAGIEERRIAELDVEAARKNPEIIKDTIGGLFADRVDGSRTVRHALEHVLMIGKPATEYLAEILQAEAGDGTARWMRQFGLTNAVPEWRWRTGMRIAMVLAQLRDPAASEAMLLDMAEPIMIPRGLPDEKQVEWNAVQRNRIKFDGWGLASVFPKDLYVDALRIMRDPKVDGEARLHLGLALAFHFTPEAAQTLAYTVWEPEEEEVPMLEDSDDLPPPARRAVFVTRFVQLLAYAVDYERLSLFEQIFGEDIELTFGDMDGFEDIAARVKEPDVQLLLVVPQACRKNLECYKNIVAGKAGSAHGNTIAYDPNTSVNTGDEESDAYLRIVPRTKAALVLSRWPAKGKDALELFDFIAEAYKVLPYNDSINIDLRRALLLGLERLGAENPEHAVEALKRLENHESAQNDPSVIVWNQRLRGLRYFFEG